MKCLKCKKVRFMYPITTYHRDIVLDGYYCRNCDTEYALIDGKLMELEPMPDEMEYDVITDKIDEIIEQHKLGVSVTELAETYNTHRTTIYYHLQRRRVYRPKKPTTKALDKAKLIIEAYRKYQNKAKTSEELGIPASTVNYYLINYGGAV